MRRVLVTGASGMLASELCLRAPRGVTAVGTDLRPGTNVPAGGFDLADPARIADLFREHGPFDGVIHAAAFTAVDLAEAQEEAASRANEGSARELAKACAAASIPLVLVSTDFVFDGAATRPYKVDDATNPLSVYGRTKLAGEIAARAAHPGGTRVVRSQWLYGPRGKHFPGTILALAKERSELRVVHDQVGCPTSTLELAPALWDVLEKGDTGVYHAACQGQASWYELAVATLELAGVRGVNVVPVTTSEFPRPAVRPRYSVLDCSRLVALRGRSLAPWRDALQDFLAQPSA